MIKDTNTRFRVRLAIDNLRNYYNNHAIKNNGTYSEDNNINKTTIIFSESGFYCEFVVNWNSLSVDFLEDSEHDDAHTISFDDFIKWLSDIIK